MMSSRKSRAVKILTVLVMIPVLGAAGAYVWINRIADARWAAAEARIHQLSAAFPEGEPRGDSAPVTAAAKENQIHLVAAIRQAAPKRDRDSEAVRLLSEGRGGEAVETVLDEAQDFLDRLHQGGRRIAASPADFPPRWHGDWDTITLGYMMSCGVLRARQQRQRKAPLEAAETLLDSLQLARFWTISGREADRVHTRNAALNGIRTTLDELRDLLSSDPLPEDGLRRLERELEPHDAALQSPLRDLEPAFARWGQALASCSDPRDMGVHEPLPAPWRFFLPERFVKAEAFEFMDRSLQRAMAGGSGGYPDLRRILQSIEEEGQASRNPFIRHDSKWAGDLSWTELERKAQLRLLRAAAHYRATGEIPNLPDPFGSSIRHAESGTRMKFWSLGQDGKDNGADPADERRWYRIGYSPDDLIIEVPRRP